MCTKKFHSKSILASALALLLMGCEPLTDPLLVETQSGPVIVDIPAKTVCDPFQNNPTHIGSDLNHGVLGTLFYLSSGSPHYTRVAEYQKFGTEVDVSLFFGQIHVATRAFDLGFTTQDGTLVTNQDGNKLYEYFSIRFESQIQLSDTDPEGDYQFAILADDGAVLEIDQGGGFRTLVDNDGNHPTRLAGSLEPIALNRSRPLPIQLNYYQGPRFHVAVTLLWRPFPAADQPYPVNDPLFGRLGNGLFFDSTKVPSRPQTAFQQLLSRGWQVVAPQNFILPERIRSNPCNKSDTKPVGVSDFCSTGEFVPKASVKVGLSSDPADGSAASTSYGLKSLGFTPLVYTHDQIAAGQPQTDGVNVLVVSRVATQQKLPTTYIDGLKSFLSSGGSVIGEYDGAALFFTQFAGAPPIMDNFNPSFGFFDASVSGGGTLIPINDSTQTVVDANDPLMAGMPASFLVDYLGAFAVSGQNASWLHTSAAFTSSGQGSVPAGTFPAVMSGQCSSGRVVLLPLTDFDVITSPPVNTLVKNSIRWAAGQ